MSLHRIDRQGISIWFLAVIFFGLAIGWFWIGLTLYRSDAELPGLLSYALFGLYLIYRGTNIAYRFVIEFTEAN